MDKQSCGLLLKDCSLDIDHDLKIAWQSGYEYVVTNTCSQAYRKQNPDTTFHDMPRTKQFCGETSIEHHLNLCQWNHQIVQRITTLQGNETLEILESNNDSLRIQAEQDFRSQFQSVQYVQNPAIIIPIPRIENPVNFSRTLHEMMNSGSVPCWIETPMMDDVSNKEKEMKQIEYNRCLSGWRAETPQRALPQKFVWRSVLQDKKIKQNSNKMSVDEVKEILKDVKGFKHPEELLDELYLMENVHELNLWKCWNFIRFTCDSNPRIGLLIRITATIPDEKIVEKWLGEPVRGILIPTSLFVTNRSGFPILTKNHQSLIKKFFDIPKCEVIIEPVESHIDGDELKGMEFYKQYRV